MACGSDTEGGAPDAEETVGGGSDGVHAADTDLGTILVDPGGFTLYVFTADTEGESTCYDACADLWPPVPGDTPVSSELDALAFGTTVRTDGSEQLTVNGQPLYLYTPDSTPGDTNGQGFNDVWFVVGTGGTMIGGVETTPTGGEDRYGY